MRQMFLITRTRDAGEYLASVRHGTWTRDQSLALRFDDRTDAIEAIGRYEQRTGEIVRLTSVLEP